MAEYAPRKLRAAETTMVSVSVTDILNEHMLLRITKRQLEYWHAIYDIPLHALNAPRKMRLGSDRQLAAVSFG